MILRAMARTRFANFVDHLDTDCCWVTTAEDRPTDIGFLTLPLFCTTTGHGWPSCHTSLLSSALSSDSTTESVVHHFHALPIAFRRSNGDKPIAGYTGQEQR